MFLHFHEKYNMILFVLKILDRIQIKTLNSFFSFFYLFCLLHAPPPLAARGFKRRCQKIQANRGSGTVSSPLPFPTGGEGNVTCKSQENTTIIFILFFSSKLVLPSLILGLLFFPSLGGRFVVVRGGTPRRLAWS
jgi:hypothetical protein